MVDDVEKKVCVPTGEIIGLEKCDELNLSGLFLFGLNDENNETRYISHADILRCVIVLNELCKLEPDSVAKAVSYDIPKLPDEWIKKVSSILSEQGYEIDYESLS